ncbi:MAG: BMP family ABC transporter substrate-binding protein [Chloroflexota bacterium]
MKKLFAVLALLVVASMVLSACGPKPTEPPAMTEPPVVATEPPVATEPAALDCAAEDVFCVGFVTDTGGINDDSFNETQYAGILRAQEELGVHAQYIQSDEATQYTPNLTEFASQNYDLIVAAGFFLGADTANVAAQYPDTEFAIFDYGYPDPFLPDGNPGKDACVPNVMGQVFKTDQAAFLAGYLAAGMALELDPEDPAIGYFGGAKIPTVTIFAVGAQFGMDKYNEVHGTNVRMIGWDNETGEGLFTGDFSDLTKGKEAAESLFDEGADIFMGVGGLIGAPGFDVARERGGYGIWVDTDGYVSLQGVQDVILTSIMKNMDVSNYTVVKSALEGTFEGCTNYVGDIPNGGVGLGPYHDLDSKVPAELKAEVDALLQQILSGEITDTGCISYPASCPQGLYE